jgi:hypothetical protein
MIIYVFKSMKIVSFFSMGEKVGAGAGAKILDKLESKPHKNGPAPQHWPSGTGTQEVNNYKELSVHTGICGKTSICSVPVPTKVHPTIN